jgi:hypothetical protein
VARVITSQERADQQFVVFPLFMAGVATSEPQENGLCLGMVGAVERLSYGRTTESVREVLEKIYEKQQAAMVASGDAFSVDWVEEMEVSGQPSTIYGYDDSWQDIGFKE